MKELTAGEYSLVSDMILDLVHYRLNNKNANYDIIIKTLYDLLNEEEQSITRERIEERFGVKLWKKKHFLQK